MAKQTLQRLSWMLSRVKHSAAARLPSLISPQPGHLTIAVTASCNLRCRGCRYGRDFMVGEKLSLETVLQVLDDAREVGINRVRYYGGEPLLHPDLASMVEHSTSLGMDSYVTTNGLLLREKIDDLYAAGMRWLTVGFYGIGDKYDTYTQRQGRFEVLDESLACVRARYGDRIEMQLNWVLMRPTCSVEALEEAWQFAERHRMAFIVDLVSYSLPFFNDGPEGELAFQANDRAIVDEVGAALKSLKERYPHRLPQSRVLINAIPDILMQGSGMRLPCDAYESLWIGADGTVQLCDVAFRMGNVNEIRLREIVYGRQHRKACRDAFSLKCPNCTCRLNSRVLKHAESVRRYA